VAVVFLAPAVATMLTATTPATAPGTTPATTPATTPGSPFYEQVPVRIHGHDTSWPPVLIVAVLVVVVGGLFLAMVFLRNVRATLRAERRND